MCLILFAYHAHPGYPLIIVANRDEFYQRPAAPAAFWEDLPHILAGRDLEQMGTWLGVNRQGRFGAVTNYRGKVKAIAQTRSRGELVTNFLANNIPPEQYLKETRQIKDHYQGFNLLVGDLHNLYYYSNVENNIIHVEPGIHGLSNAFLNTSWPKVVHGKKMLKQTVLNSITHKTELNIEHLFSILAHAEPFTDEELPQTGIGIEWERKLSPLFISSPEYGTRASTVLVVQKSGLVHFQERTFSSAGQQTEPDVHYTYTI